MQAAQGGASGQSGSSLPSKQEPPTGAGPAGAATHTVAQKPPARSDALWPVLLQVTELSLEGQPGTTSTSQAGPWGWCQENLHKYAMRERRHREWKEDLELKDATMWEPATPPQFTIQLPWN